LRLSTVLDIVLEYLKRKEVRLNRILVMWFIWYPVLCVLEFCEKVADKLQQPKEVL